VVLSHNSLGDAGGLRRLVLFGLVGGTLNALSIGRIDNLMKGELP
jgi:hypothetical protein